MTIYDNVKQLCEKNGINISTLEKKAHLGNGVIGGWRTSVPKLNTLKAVADELKVTVDELLA